MTTYYFIRHAEKEHNGRESHLTSKGKKRAQQWAEILEDLDIEMIYCTAIIRTQETARPLQKKLGVEIKIYDTSDLYSPQFQKETKGKTVLVVGHQNTTPTFINRIIKERKYGHIPPRSYSNLYKVVVHDNGNTTSLMRTLSF